MPDFIEGRKRLDAKIALLHADDLHDLKIADYGTRRRFSKAWHEEVLRVLIARLGAGPAGQFAGTSNVLFAMKLGLTPLGTMAHEYLQACQALGPRLRDSQVFAFESWAKEYRGDLGIALSPTSTASTPSCATSTCTSASCSTARATTAATPLPGASA